MIVRNKKTGKEYSISTADWEILKERKQTVLFTVVDASELTAKKTMPIEIAKIIKHNTQDGNIQVSGNETAKPDRRRSTK